MKLFKSLTIAGLMLVSTSALIAQEAKKDFNPEEKAEKITEKMSAELGLDESKSAALLELNVDFVNNLYSLKQEASDDKEAIKERKTEIIDAHDASLKELLSADEWTKYEAFKAEKMEKRKEKKEMSKKSPEERAEMKTKHMTEILDLSDEQVRQIGDLNLKVELKIDAVKKNDSMDEEKKKEHIKGNRKDYKRALSVILTEEQMTTLKEAKKEHKSHGMH